MRAGSVRTELVSKVRQFQKDYPRPWASHATGYGEDYMEDKNGQPIDNDDLMEYMNTLEELCGLEFEVPE